ncbi:M48 family metallopeptidase [Hymenobacter sp. BT175]|uniref:M48 family metallopeptidase n=1 Tax=Hymenobacter translucens TaxID=2886507 RepID=UPI001D0F1C7F|nr:M48 family metallopeptidase [Hymenobacter translucens]MCC2546530.1 M48 family metallopeptidase [Hymenobacter translucens]
MLKKLVLATGLLVAAGCTTVPITGRQQLSLVSDAEMNTLAEQQYREVLSKSQLSADANQTAMVRRVGQRIQQAVETYFRQQNASDQLAGYAWEFNVIQDDKQQNAWCMPGGKVAVYTGILPITQDETGLAVVMGHEIAHAVAKHGNERMSQGLVQQLGGQALSAALSSKPEATQSIFLQAFGVGSSVGLLKYGRNQETEADHLGLIFMAMAGYNPDGAVAFWQRMEAGQNGAAPPEFLSTHPSSGTRIANIQRELPEARKYYTPR